MIAMKQTILLLASDPAVRRSLDNALESKGYFVLAADTIDAAARWLGEYTPDLLIVREYTEGMSGHDAAVFLRRIANGVPVLIVSGFIDDYDLEVRETVHDFETFPKPFTRSELLDKVQEILAKHPPKSPAGDKSP